MVFEAETGGRKVQFLEEKTKKSRGSHDSEGLWLSDQLTTTASYRDKETLLSSGYPVVHK